MPGPTRPPAKAADLIGAHRSALIRYAGAITGSRALADDIVQEAWLKLRDVHDPALIREPLGYLYRVVRNLAVDARRVLNRETARDAGPADEVLPGVADAGPSPEQAATVRQELANVLEALEELPERTRIAVRMNRIEGRKLKEVAEHLGLSIGRTHALIVEGVAHCDRRRRS